MGRIVYVRGGETHARLDGDTDVLCCLCGKTTVVDGDQTAGLAVLEAHLSRDHSGPITI